MNIMINLAPEQFRAQPDEIFRNTDFVVTAFSTEETGEVLMLANSRGVLSVLPFRDLTIWDADFDGYSLKSGRRSTRFVRRKLEGSSAFHSPWPYQEGSVVSKQKVWLQIDGQTLSLYASGEPADQRYRLRPAVRLAADSAQFTLEMHITNLADEALPIRYVCQLNYGCIPTAIFRQNLPVLALAPPGHIAEQGVLCSDDLSLYVDQAEFFMLASKGRRYVTRFSTAQFNYGLRPVTQQGGLHAFRFIQPATCRPHGESQLPGMMLAVGKTREFCVTTGVV